MSTTSQLKRTGVLRKCVANLFLLLCSRNTSLNVCDMRLVFLQLSGPYNLDLDSSFESPVPRRQSFVSQEFDLSINDIFDQVEAMFEIEGQFSTDHPVYMAVRRRASTMTTTAS